MKNDTCSVDNNIFENNDVGRDINQSISTINYNEIKKKSTALVNLINRSKILKDTDKEYKYMLEQLQEYLTPKPGRKIIGLEEKLNEGGRQDLLEEALFLENKFARRVSRGQFSISEEMLYYHCLSKINTLFANYIKPLFKNTVEIAIIDRTIIDRIVEPLYEETTEVDASISMDLIRGMIFFLTGKCHLRWVG